MKIKLLPTDASNFKGKTDTEQVLNMVGVVEFTTYYLGTSEADELLVKEIEDACEANNIRISPSSIKSVGTPLSWVYRYLPPAAQVQVMVAIAVNHYGLYGVKPVE